MKKKCQEKLINLFISKKVTTKRKQKRCDDKHFQGFWDSLQIDLLTGFCNGYRMGERRSTASVNVRDSVIVNPRTAPVVYHTGRELRVISLSCYWIKKCLEVKLQRVIYRIFWQRGQKWLEREAMTARCRGVPQCRQGNPVRP